jgi:hypothetical protein
MNGSLSQLITDLSAAGNTDEEIVAELMKRGLSAPTAERFLERARGSEEAAPSFATRGTAVADSSEVRPGLRFAAGSFIVLALLTLLSAAGFAGLPKQAPSSAAPVALFALVMGASLWTQGDRARKGALVLLWLGAVILLGLTISFAKVTAALLLGVFALIRQFGWIGLLQGGTPSSLRVICGATAVLVGWGGALGYQVHLERMLRPRIFTSVEGAFRVIVPGTPEHRTRVFETAYGPGELHSYVSRGAHGMAYAVTSIKSPALQGDPEAILVNARNNALEGAKSQLVTDGWISLDGHRGRQFVGANADGATLHGRIYLVGQRLYSLVVIVPKDRAVQEKVDHFFESFKLTG